MERRAVLGLLTLSFALLVSPARAQNLLLNPHFDTTVSDWDPLGATPSWNSDDAHGSSSSGSLSVTVGGDLPVGVSQCVALDGSAQVEQSSYHRRGSGTGTAFSTDQVWWYDTPGCTGFISTEFFNTDVNDAWARNAATWSVPSGAVSAVVALAAGTSSGGAAEVRFDDAFFGDPSIFADGFESGGTGAWSSVTP